MTCRKEIRKNRKMSIEGYLDKEWDVCSLFGGMKNKRKKIPFPLVYSKTSTTFAVYYYLHELKNRDV